MTTINGMRPTISDGRAAADRIEELEAKLKEAEKNAMAEALIAIQQHTTDAWVKGLRLPHLLRMVGLLRGDIR